MAGASFPRRRESSVSPDILDSRLRGNDGLFAFSHSLIALTGQPVAGASGSPKEKRLKTQGRAYSQRDFILKLPRKNWLEWTVFACGALLVLATLGVLALDAVTASHAPPRVSVKIGAVRHIADGYALSLTARNDGDQTAEGVKIAATLTPRGAGKSDEERGDFQIDYLPHNSSSSGWISFKTDPRKGDLQARVAGYSVP